MSTGQCLSRTCGISKLGGKCLLVSVGVLVSRLGMWKGVGGREEKWCLSALLFLEKSPKDHCPFNEHSEISK